MTTSPQNLIATGIANTSQQIKARHNTTHSIRFPTRSHSHIGRVLLIDTYTPNIVQ